MKAPFNIQTVFPKEREEKLRSIKRFSMFEVFLYRSSLWHHVLRVFFIVDELSKLIRQTLPNCDAQKAMVLALVHDDAEMITGDIQLGYKQVMKKEELKKVDHNEVVAIEKLAKQYPEVVGGYYYRELLLHALRKDCIEARLVSYADKLDAYCESLHEILGGNISSIRSVLNYTNLLLQFSEKFPDLKPLLRDTNSSFTNLGLRTDMWHVRKENYQHLGKPHTPESIQKDTELPVYNTWKNLVLTRLGDEGIEILTKQTEVL